MEIPTLFGCNARRVKGGVASVFHPIAICASTDEQRGPGQLSIDRSKRIEIFAGSSSSGTLTC
ncbi:MAG: hypothetical protein WC836_12550 [Desulfobacula sp.]